MAARIFAVFAFDASFTAKMRTRILYDKLEVIPFDKLSAFFEENLK